MGQLNKQASSSDHVSEQGYRTRHIAQRPHIADPATLDVICQLTGKLEHDPSSQTAEKDDYLSIGDLFRLWVAPH